MLELQSIGGPHYSNHLGFVSVSDGAGCLLIMCRKDLAAFSLAVSSWYLLSTECEV